MLERPSTPAIAFGDTFLSFSKQDYRRIILELVNLSTITLVEINVLTSVSKALQTVKVCFQEEEVRSRSVMNYTESY